MLVITLLRVIPTMTCWVRVVRLWLSSSFIPWTKRKTSNRVEKAARPASFFFRIFAWSCRVLSATQDSTCQKCSSKQVTTMPSQPCQNMSVYHVAETNMPKHATTNMPNHVRIPPVKNKHTGIKHGSIPPEAKSKAIVAATAHAQITNALQCVTRSILCTKHAKSCQDTTCQHISRINRRHQTCQ